jgi:apolipoprotein N-acyltransferase
MLSRIAHPVMLAWGLRRIAIAFVAGAVGALALEPYGIWPLMFVSFSLLVWLVDGASAGRWHGAVGGAVIGWWFGFGYLLAGLYWIGNAFLVDAKVFGWLLPIAVVGLPAFLALYTALGVALARLLWTPGALRILTLAASLTLSEWLRGHLFTGFPWNAYGYALTSALPMAQAAALVGIWMLTFIAVAVFATPALLADESKHTPRPWLALTGAAAMLIALAAFGAIRLATTPTKFVDGVRLRIMQPNLTQDEKFNYSAKASVVARYLALSNRRTGPQNSDLQNVTHLIWPESAFPFFLTREPDVLADIAKLLPQGTVLITGAARAGEPNASGRITRAYNSVYAIDHNGSILSVYDKVHLVPFGEYLPFQDFLERLGLMQLTKIHGGFIPGDRHRPIALPNTPRFLALICYEIIFPDEAVPHDEERPDWLVNVTNDGWFGLSSGPYQHLQQARVRAIEEGLPLVRAANTGVSAVTDPLGRIVKSLPLGSEGVIDATLPAPVEPTVYSRIGERHTILVLAGVFILAIVARRRRYSL